MTKCGCKIDNGNPRSVDYRPRSIIYCQLHAAAEEMLKILSRREVEVKLTDERIEEIRRENVDRPGEEDTVCCSGCDELLKHIDALSAEIVKARKDAGECLGQHACCNAIRALAGKREEGK